MIERVEIADELAGLVLFADLSPAQRQGVAHLFDERWFAADERILRQGLSGSGFHVILSGEVAVRLDGAELARLGRGDFFGEISALFGEPPVADIVALGPVRCLLLPAAELHDFLLSYPAVMYRILLDQTRRVRNANRWRG